MRIESREVRYQKDYVFFPSGFNYGLSELLLLLDDLSYTKWSGAHEIIRNKDLANELEDLGVIVRTTRGSYYAGDGYADFTERLRKLSSNA